MILSYQMELIVKKRMRGARQRQMPQNLEHFYLCYQKWLGTKNMFQTFALMTDGSRIARPPNVPVGLVGIRQYGIALQQCHHNRFVHF